LKKSKTNDQTKKGVWMQGLKLIKSRVKLKKFEICWSIEGQNAQFNNQELKLNKQLTLGVDIWVWQKWNCMQLKVKKQGNYVYN